MIISELLLVLLLTFAAGRTLDTGLCTHLVIDREAHADFGDAGWSEMSLAWRMSRGVFVR